jgi:hypothetical protein
VAEVLAGDGDQPGRRRPPADRLRQRQQPARLARVPQPRRRAGRQLGHLHRLAADPRIDEDDGAGAADRLRQLRRQSVRRHGRDVRQRPCFDGSGDSRADAVVAEQLVAVADDEQTHRRTS